MAPRKTKPSAVDGDALWAHVVRDTTPLKRKQAAPIATAPVAPGTAKPEAGKGRASARPTEPRPAPALPPLSAATAPGVDKRTAERLKKGQLEVEARLDLHRHTQAEAHRALIDFITASAQAGRRCVLVITGKGARTGGVLRAAVPAWLNGAELRPLLLAFRPARPRDGGDGALYVLLKRSR
ncbi:MAG: hypothetical protein GY791_01095 [Alphaproteobacteria bacterium]|nr:hypothetical protein [Alphaproteobacteria bacterium]